MVPRAPGATPADFQEEKGWEGKEELSQSMRGSPAGEGEAAAMGAGQAVAAQPTPALEETLQAEKEVSLPSPWCPAPLDALLGPAHPGCLGVQGSAQPCPPGLWHQLWDSESRLEEAAWSGLPQALQPSQPPPPHPGPDRQPEKLQATAHFCSQNLFK